MIMLIITIIIISVTIGFFGYWVFKNNPEIANKSFTEFLDKHSILTILANFSMMILVLISNIYNTTPNKQIIISYYLEKWEKQRANKLNAISTETRASSKEDESEKSKENPQESDSFLEEEKVTKREVGSSQSENVQSIVEEIDQTGNFTIVCTLLFDMFGILLNSNNK